MKVLDFDVEDGQPWIVFEYVTSPALSARLARGPLPWREALDLVEQLAAALAFAHAAAIVHRDVKAENVLESALGRWTLGPISASRSGGRQRVRAHEDRHHPGHAHPPRPRGPRG